MLVKGGTGVVIMSTYSALVAPVAVHCVMLNHLMSGLHTFTVTFHGVYILHMRLIMMWRSLISTIVVVSAAHLSTYGRSTGSCCINLFQHVSAWMFPLVFIQHSPLLNSKYSFLDTEIPHSKPLTRFTGMVFREKPYRLNSASALFLALLQ